MMDLSDAIARWWVLDDDHRARRRASSLWASTGHAAAAFGDELYDILPQTRGGHGRLQDFGIRRLRALWTDWSVEVRVLSGALEKPRSCGLF